MKSYQVLMTSSGRVSMRRLRGTRKLPGGAAAELRAAQEYLEAHALLPEDRTTLAPGQVTVLCGLLEGRDGKREDVVRALIILAHLGREPALGALRRFAERPPEGLEILADLALEECEVWAKEPRPPLAVAGAGNGSPAAG